MFLFTVRSVSLRRPLDGGSNRLRMTNPRRRARRSGSSVKGIGLGRRDSARIGGAGARMLEENRLYVLRVPGSNEVVGDCAAVNEDFLETNAILVERSSTVLLLSHGDVGVC